MAVPRDERSEFYVTVPRDAERLTLLMPCKMFCFTKHHGDNVAVPRGRGYLLIECPVKSLRSHRARKPAHFIRGFTWWARKELNLRPLRCQRSVLPLNHEPLFIWKLFGNPIPKNI